MIVKEKKKKRKRLRTEDEHAVCGANDDSVVTRSSRAPGVLFYLEKETREIHTGKGRHPFFFYITFLMLLAFKATGNHKKRRVRMEKLQTDETRVHTRELVYVWHWLLVRPTTS